MKKRVLFLNCTLGLGGVERSLCDVIRNMNPEKYEIDLYLDSTSGPLMFQIPEYVNIVQPNMDGTYGRFLTVAKELIIKKEFARLYFRLIKKLGSRGYSLLVPLFKKYGSYDIVIAYREGVITQFAYHVFRWKYFIGWWHYGGVPDTNSEYLDLDRMKYLVAVSDKSREMLQETFPYIRDKIRVIPNMVDVSRLNTIATEYKPAYRTEITNIVTVSRLSREKHLENIIFCASRLLEEGFEIQWHIVGGGLEHENLTKLIHNNGLEDVVILEGEQSNPYPYVQNADLYVHPSYVESQGLTVLEAMALGVPCVVTKSLGPCEFMEDGVNGLLTEQSPEDLTEKVVQILTDQELYQRIKENTCCPEQFLPERVIEKIEQLLEESMC